MRHSWKPVDRRTKINAELIPEKGDAKLMPKRQNTGQATMHKLQSMETKITKRCAQSDQNRSRKTLFQATNKSWLIEHLVTKGCPRWPRAFHLIGPWVHMQWERIRAYTVSDFKEWVIPKVWLAHFMRSSFGQCAVDWHKAHGTFQPCGREASAYESVIGKVRLLRK